MTATPDQVIAQIREENAALAADRDAWIEAAIRQRKRAEAAEAERDALRKGLERLRDATPGSTNSSNASEAFMFVRAVSNTALNTAAMPHTLSGDKS